MLSASQCGTADLVRERQCLDENWPSQLDQNLPSEEVRYAKDKTALLLRPMACTKNICTGANRENILWNDGGEGGK